MPCGDDLEEQIACLSVQLHVTELVNDEHLRSSVTIQFIFQTVGLLRMRELVDHLRCRHKERGDALLAGRIPQGTRQMGFPHPGSSGKNSARQASRRNTLVEFHIGLLDRSGRLVVREIKGIDRLHALELGRPDFRGNRLGAALGLLRLGPPIQGL